MQPDYINQILNLQNIWGDVMERVVVIAEESERKLIDQYLPGCEDRVIVSGVGAFNIIQSLRDLPPDTEIINIGYAGSTNFEIGSVMEVSESKLNHPSVTYEEPMYHLHVTGKYPQAVCYTNTDFVLQSRYNDCLFDMELAFIMVMGFEKVRSIKVVSDNLSLHSYRKTATENIGYKKPESMDKIPSFTVNHLKLLRGIYVSRKDAVGGEIVTTFDIRMKEPNREPALTPEVSHTIEHLAATYLRNEPTWKDWIVYWGPMGCLTGHYLIVKGDLESREILELMKNTFAFIAEYEGEVPGANPHDCGNWSMMDLEGAKAEARKYLTEVIVQAKARNLEYPED